MKYLLLLSTLLFLFACKSYQLSQSDLAWNPYNVNDRLIFKSNTGKMDTILIQKIDRSTSKNEQYSPTSGTSEQMAVLARVRVPYNLDTGETQLMDGHPIFALIADKGGAMANMMLDVQNTIFPNSVISIKELEKKQVISKKIGGKIYNDLIVLKPSNTYPEKGATRYTDVLYWSKSKGYVRFDVSAEEYWELVD